MENRAYSSRTLAIIERINQARTADETLAVFEGAIVECGAAYFGLHFLPRPEQALKDVSLAWRIVPGYRSIYIEQDYIHADPGFRHARRTVMPFDWESAPFDPETEPRCQQVVDCAHDFNTHKGITIPVPSPSGMIGVVGVAGPHFDERESHMPMLHSVGLHAFYRLERLLGRRGKTKTRLTDREREVLSWAAEGKTAWEIGCILSLSQRTVEGHFFQACKKLGASNRAQAIAIFGGMLI